MPAKDPVDVAIIGMACRVAGANSTTELWDLLATSKDVQSEITRFNARGYYHPKGGPLKGLTNVKDAYMLDDDLVDRFDHTFFRITPQEAMAIDPQQRLLLEVAYEAVENAGVLLDDFIGSNTSVYTGAEGCDYHTILARDIDTTPKYLATGTATCMTANRISYFFDLTGPSFAVDSACSSSMSALHSAVMEIQRSECKMSLVCGAKLILNPDMFMPSTELGFLSPSGKCQTFDASADGYGRGEGVIALLLKPLDEALRCNDPIRAVIKGTRLNQDGRTQGITLPSATAQKNNIEALYSEIGISPAEIQYFEAHGTGTAAGDPLEMSAVNAVFQKASRPQKLVIGSVKSNIGHLEACSALAGIVKTVEAMEHGMIPPQMHFVKPNPKIDFSILQIPVEMLPWPENQTSSRIAAVNSFGAGGTNGHAVLEAHPKRRRDPCKQASRPLLFKLSANSEKVLQEMSQRLVEYLEKSNPDLNDLAFTLLSRRSTMAKSKFFVASTMNELVNNLTSSSPRLFGRPATNKPGVIFVFTGQGAQWPGMGKELLNGSLVFRSTIEECQQYLDDLPDRPLWAIEEELSKPAESSNVYKSSFSQPLCTILQLGIIHLLQSWGLSPAAVLGHSSGEVAAAYAAGMITLRDATVISYYRGLFLSGAASSGTNGSRIKHGSMCAINLDQVEAAKMTARYDQRIQLAAINSPTNCTLSGDANVIQEIVEEAKEKGIFCRELRVDTAFHSHHVAPAASRYAQALQDAGISQTKNATCTMFSTVKAVPISPQDCTPEYWAENMAGTVRFAPALTECLNSLGGSPLACLEIGPHPALKAPSQETARALDRDLTQYFHTCYRGRPAFESLLESVSEMLMVGVKLNTSQINAVDENRGSNDNPQILTDLPPYPWDHSTSFWFETEISTAVRKRKHRRHVLLGSRSLDDSSSLPSWRNHLRMDEVPFLKDTMVFLGPNSSGVLDSRYALFISMAAEAARQWSIDNEHTSQWQLTGLKFDLSDVPQLDESKEIVNLHFNSRCTKNGLNFEVISVKEKQSRTECTGKIEPIEQLETFNAAAGKISNNQGLVMAAERLGRHVPTILKDVQISEDGAIGSFDSTIDTLDESWLELEVLHAIFTIPLISSSSKFLPARLKLASIRSVMVGEIKSEEPNQFEVRTVKYDFYSSISDIRVVSRSQEVLFQGVRMEVDQLTELLLHGIFLSRPSRKLDIGQVPRLDRCSLTDLLALVTHRWPMADIGISSAANLDFPIDTMLDIIRGQELSFRSIQIQQDDSELRTDGKVQFVQQFHHGFEFHFLFIKEKPEQLSSLLRPCGLVCVPESVSIDEDTDGLALISSLEPLGDTSWKIYRKQPTEQQQFDSSDHTVIFANSLILRDHFPKAQYLPLELNIVRHFCTRPPSSKYVAIVVEDPEEAVIHTWKGTDILPWFRNLMTQASKIIWVTRSKGQNPFQEVTGILLRTLQAEHPSLRVTWITVEAEEDGASISEKIHTAYSSLAAGDGETKVVWKDGYPEIVRYMPDNELCAMIGVNPSVIADMPLSGKEYSLNLAAKDYAAICPSAKIVSVDADLVTVNVTASVIDIFDLLAFKAENTAEEAEALGMFFSGVVMESGSSNLASGALVAGFTKGAHSGNVRISSENLFGINSQSLSGDETCEFALCAISIAVVDGLSRIRSGDTVEVDNAGPLGDVLKWTVERFGGVINSKVERNVDFHIEACSKRGLLVNGRPVRKCKIETYLRSSRGRETFMEIWKDYNQTTSCKHFSLTGVNKALKTPLEEAYTTVLIHEPTAGAVKQMVTYQKRDSLFSSSGTYMIIGGLGGLGRYICSWMISNGAKNLVIMSRSGIKTTEAQQVYDELNASGANLKVMQVDACDLEAMKSAFALVRSEGPIRGVMNMAMILGDASIAAMTSEQWDSAFRLKVDSSWNLHQVTKDDELEFCILFSSIASILANRNQGGYNVGNAFLNALAEYRHRLGLPAVSIVLGAMTEIGVLHELGKTDLHNHLTRAGLTSLTKHSLSKIMEAAILDSPRRTRPVIVTGLETFDRVNGKLVGSQDQTQLYWTELPEFGHLQNHRWVDSTVNSGDGVDGPTLRDQVFTIRTTEQSPDQLQLSKLYSLLLTPFLQFLAQLQGFDQSSFEPETGGPLAGYGFDSLSAVSCQFWFHRELDVDVSAGEVLGSQSIAGLVRLACQRIQERVLSVPTVSMTAVSSVDLETNTGRNMKRKR